MIWLVIPLSPSQLCRRTSQSNTKCSRLRLKDSYSCAIRLLDITVFDRDIASGWASSKPFEVQGLFFDNHVVGQILDDFSRVTVTQKLPLV